MKFVLRNLLVPAAVAVIGTSAAFAQEEPTGIQDTTPIAINLQRTNVKYDGWYNFSVGTPLDKVIDGVHYAFDVTDRASKPGLSGVGNGYPTAFNSANAYPNPVLSQLHSATGYDLSTPGYAATYDANKPRSTQAAFNKVANGDGSGGLSKFNADGTRNAQTWGGSGFGPMPSGGSLYGISFSNNYNARGGTLGVFEANPVSNLDRISLQIQIGSANGYDFYEPDVSGVTGLDGAPEFWGGASGRPLGELTNFESWSPVLVLTFADGSTLDVVADTAAILAKGENGTIPMPTGPGGQMVDEAVIINLYGFEWDLSDIAGEIASFVITWDVVEHSQSYAVRLDQGGNVIPEPSTYALLIGGGVAALVAIRRQRRCA